MFSAVFGADGRDTIDVSDESVFNTILKIERLGEKPNAIDDWDSEPTMVASDSTDAGSSQEPCVSKGPKSPEAEVRGPRSVEVTPEELDMTQEPRSKEPRSREAEVRGTEEPRSGLVEGGAEVRGAEDFLDIKHPLLKEPPISPAGILQGMGGFINRGVP